MPPRRMLSGLLLAAVLAGGCVPGRTGSGDDPSTPASRSPAVSADPTPSGPTPVPSFTRPTPTPLPTFVVHVVEPGETLTSIARLHRTTGRSIAHWNREAYPSLDPASDEYEPDRIVVGWALRLIPGLEYDAEDLLEPSG
ncbi:MAG: LysM peptidoglycan-binding domain-containing protein [Candidatus Limnocylindria bacterium]